MSKLHMATVAALLFAAVGAVFQPSAAVQAYHFSLLACLQPALGSLFLILLYQSTGGRWGERIMPALLVGNRLLPWCFLALIPVIVFLPAVYRWGDDPAFAGDRVIFLNRPFFAIRCAVYLVVLGGLSVAVSRGRRPAAGGLILFALIGYFVSVDLVMAIDPRWYSSGFPIVFMSSGAMMGLSLAITVRALLSTTIEEIEDRKAWRDLGNLLLAMVVFWSYVSFTQYLIIWMGNLPKEIQWYAIRGAGIWKWMTIFLTVANLFAPFFVLLSRAVKDRPQRLMWVSAAVFACQVVYLYWLVAPSYPGRNALGIHWLDPVFLACLGLLFASGYQSIYRKEERCG